jgi:hypothetical protein
MQQLLDWCVQEHLQVDHDQPEYLKLHEPKKLSENDEMFNQFFVHTLVEFSLTSMTSFKVKNGSMLSEE